MTIFNAPTKFLYEKETPIKKRPLSKEKETLLGIYLEIVNLKVVGDCNKN